MSSAKGKLRSIFLFMGAIAFVKRVWSKCSECSDTELGSLPQGDLKMTNLTHVFHFLMAVILACPISHSSWFCLNAISISII